MKKFLTAIFSFLLLGLPSLSFAQSATQSSQPFKGFLDFLPGACMEYGNCGVQDIMWGFIFLTKFLIGAIGAIALLYFIWGGIQWLTSYGNLEKVRNGREIMLQTVIALFVAFMSFILVEFFINDFLLGGNNSQFQVGSGECVGASKGYSCGDNQVCTGSGFTGEAAIYNNLCVSRCDLKNVEDPDNTWLCFDRNFVADAPEKFDGCTNPDELCVNATSFDPTLPEMPIIEDEDSEFGCCISGIRACHTELFEEDCLDGESWSNFSCDDVALCQFGYHESAGCCLGYDSGGDLTACENQSSGQVCEWGAGITPSFISNTNCPDTEPLCL